MSVDLTKGATVELVKTLSDDLRTKDDNTKYSSAGAAMRDKANVDGYYENLVSGGTEQLLSSVYEEDSEPYLFRTSGGSMDIGDREEDTIVGGTISWNQQIYNGNFASDTGWGVLAGGTKSIANNEAVLTLSANFAGIQSTASAYLPTDISGHKYLISADIKSSVVRTNSVGLGLSDTSSHYPVRKIFSVGTSYANYAFVGTQTDGTVSGRLMVYDTKGADGLTLYVKNIQCFDLTQMFGSAIADYIYSLETATAGAGVAFFKKLFPKPYYAYDAGSLKSVEGLSAHKMTGFNQWNTATDNVGKNLTAQGELQNAPNYSTSDYIKVVPNATYYIKGVPGSTYAYAGAWYDANKVYISSIAPSGASYDVSALRTVPSNAAYVRLTRHNTTAESCFNLSWDGERDGEYEPYEEHVYDLDSSLTLRGIPKLDSNNNLYYDGDVYKSDGTVERKYGVVTLKGTEQWYTAPNDAQAYFFVNASASYLNTAVRKPIVCDKFTVGKTTENISQYADNTVWYIYRQVHVKVSSTIAPSGLTNEGIAELKAWLANNPITVLLPLKEETTEEAEPYQTPQIVDDFGTEEYVTDSIVPVGHVTKYMPNLKAKLEMAPDSPSENGDFVVRHTNGLNEYVPLVIPTELPAMPTTTDGSYKLVCTVTNGVATMSWETNE